MAIKKSQKTIGIISAILGLIQGLAYGILCIVTITYYNNFNRKLEFSNYNDLLNFFMWKTFMQTKFPKGSDSEGSLVQRTFFAFLIVSALLNFAWAILSVVQIIVILRNKVNRIVGFSFRVWSILTLIISAFDLALIIFISVNSSSCNKDSSLAFIFDKLTLSAVCDSMAVYLLLVASKGVSIWIVNIAAGAVVFKISLQINEEVKNLMDFRGIPRVKVARNQPFNRRQENSQKNNYPYGVTSPQNQHQWYNEPHHQPEQMYPIQRSMMTKY